jgi:hypothetical protein
MSHNSDNPYQSTINSGEMGKPSIEGLESAVRVNQIIVIALAAGLVTFLAFAIFQVFQREQPLNLNFGMITLIGMGLLIGSIPVSFILPAVMQQAQTSKTDAGSEIEQLKQSYSTQLILACAIVEGPSFVNIYAFMTEHNPLSVFAALIGVAMILVRLPTKFGMRAWINKRLSGH